MRFDPKITQKPVEVTDTKRRRLVEISGVTRSPLMVYSDGTGESVTRVPRKLIGLHVGVLSLAGQGGSGQVARASANALAAAGFRVSVFTDDGFFDAALNAQVGQVKVSCPSAPISPSEAEKLIHKPSERVTTLAQEIASYARVEKLDVLFVHYGAELLDAAFLAQKTLAASGKTLKISVVLHGTDVTALSSNDVELTAHRRKQLLACDSVFAVSSWLAGKAKEVFSLPYEPSVIENAVDTATFSAAAWVIPEHEVGRGRDIQARIAPQGEWVIGHTSNFRPVKRPLDVIRCFAALKAKNLPCKLLLVGDGPMVEDASKLAEALGVGEDVIWVGAVDQQQLARYYAACHVTLVSSESESFSLAALESMACGTPVVGTRCGGLEEVLANDEKLLVNVGDVDAMANKVAALLKSSFSYSSASNAALSAPFERFPRDAQSLAYSIAAIELFETKSNVKELKTP